MQPRPISLPRLAVGSARLVFLPVLALQTFAALASDWAWSTSEQFDAFYVGAASLALAAPRWRLAAVAAVMIAFDAAIELVQLLKIVDHSPDLGDFGGGVIGIIAALAPMKLGGFRRRAAELPA